MKDVKDVGDKLGKSFRDLVTGLCFSHTQELMGCSYRCCDSSAMSPSLQFLTLSVLVYSF